MTPDTIRAAELRSEAEERIGSSQLHADDWSRWVSDGEADRIFGSVAFLEAKTAVDRATLAEAIDDLNTALGLSIRNLEDFHGFEITASSLLDPMLREAALKELQAFRISGSN